MYDRLACLIIGTRFSSFTTLIVVLPLVIVFSPFLYKCNKKNFKIFSCYIKSTRLNLLLYIFSIYEKINFELAPLQEFHYINQLCLLNVTYTKKRCDLFVTAFLLSIIFQCSANFAFLITLLDRFPFIIIMFPFGNS